MIDSLTTPYIRMKPEKQIIYPDKKNEDFHKSGIYTSGFWATNLLWDKKTLTESIDDVNKRFNINVKLI